MCDLFLGIDLSTQSCKATLLDASLTVTHSATVIFEEDLPQYNAKGGILIREGGVVVSPTLMWVEALDLLFSRLKESGVSMNLIKSIGVSGQQHGSVYWKKGSRSLLANLCSKDSLVNQLKDAFSINESPIWMDSSTVSECAALEESIGGSMKLAEITGSKAYTRFTGNQIARIAKLYPEAYENTERISLVSSFATSILCGDYANIDMSDGSGMNLLDIRTHQWHIPCLNACAPNLNERLGDPVPTTTLVGKIHSYFVEKYGLSPSCDIVCGSGDNPCSLVGLRMNRPGDIAISLGTSNTVFALMKECKTDIEGHVFVSPLDESMYMKMLCYSNGDFVRTRTCQRYADNDWNVFSQLVEQSPPGNNGFIYIDRYVPEITPDSRVCGIFMFNGEGDKVESLSPCEYCRGIIESQVLSMRLHLEKTGFNQFERLIVTGGASVNRSILQIIADVFQADVFTINVKDSASVGAGIRGYIGYLKERNPDLSTEAFFDERTNEDSLRKVASPNHELKKIYDEMISKYSKIESSLSIV